MSRVWLKIFVLSKTAIRNVPKDWELVVREARPMSPFTVVPMDASKFLDFAELPKQYTPTGKRMLISPFLSATPMARPCVYGGFSHVLCFVASD